MRCSRPGLSSGPTAQDSSTHGCPGVHWAWAQGRQWGWCLWGEYGVVVECLKGHMQVRQMAVRQGAVCTVSLLPVQHAGALASQCWLHPPTAQGCQDWPLSAQSPQSPPHLGLVDTGAEDSSLPGRAALPHGLRTSTVSFTHCQGTLCSCQQQMLSFIFRGAGINQGCSSQVSVLR